MKNNLKTKTASAKKFVSDHRVAIAVTATSYLWLELLKRATEGHNEFLKENGLYEKFYAMDEES